MAPPFRGSAGNPSNSSGNSITINAPAGVQAGDQLICVLNPCGNNINALTPPSGWSTLENINPGYIWVLAKTASASEPASYTFGFDHTLTCFGVILAYQNAVVDVHAHSSNFGDPGVSPTVTTTGPNETVVTIFSVNATNGGFFAPSSGTNRLYLYLNTSIGSAGIEISDATQAAAGTSTGVTDSVSAAETWQSVQIALKSGLSPIVMIL